MNQDTRAGSSNAPQFLPVKRRGRPRKDPSLKRLAIAPLPPGFGVRENKFHQADKNDDTDGGMVGQAVTGVIEGTFDAGYLLTVRIGNLNANFRGVVFKPGKFIPVTARNDIAPQVQMIKRNEVYFPTNNPVQSNNESGGRSESNGALHFKQGVRFVPQSTALVASKGKNAAPIAGSSSHLGGRGTLVPVVLQPINVLNGSLSSNQALPEPAVSRDKDVVTAEPLAMLLPEGSSSSSRFWAVKNQQFPSSHQTSNQAPAGSIQNANDSSRESNGVVRQKEETKGLKQTNVPAAVESMTGMQGTSESLQRHVDNSNLVASSSHMNLDQRVSDVQSPYASISMKNYGTGRMIELLQAVQENVKPLVGARFESQELQNPN